MRVGFGLPISLGLLMIGKWRRFKRILPNQDDLMLMREAKDGCFSVKLFYKVLFGSNSIVFPH